MKEVIISKNEAGQRFDKFLLKYLNKSTSSFVYKMLRKKNIVLNDKKATGNEHINIGDNVKLYLSDETIDKFRDTSSLKNGSKKGVTKAIASNQNYTKLLNRLSVVYEDEDVLFINKEAGILSQKNAPNDISINELAISYLLNNKSITPETLLTFKPSICNRLDRNTSGLITVGKSLKGSQYLSKVFKERSINKYYLALVFGEVKESLTIEGYLHKDESQNKVTIKSYEFEDSSYIKTSYEPLKYENGLTLLKIHLYTGKTHQIRAHLASVGHALCGDYKYGRKHDNDMFKNKYNINYQMLHSYELEFEGISYIAKLPSNWPVQL